MSRKRRTTRRRRYRPFRRIRRPKSIPLSMIPSIAVPVGMMLAGNEKAGHTGLIKAFQTGDMSWIAHEFANIIPYETVGYKWDGGWDWSIIARNLGLIMVGGVVHKLANRFGANNYMKRVPLVGKYLSI